MWDKKKERKKRQLVDSDFQVRHILAGALLSVRIEGLWLFTTTYLVACNYATDPGGGFQDRALELFN